MIHPRQLPLQHGALFLDRDGVINRRLLGTYVLQPEQFEMLPGVAGAIATLSNLFSKVFVVTNQQGIGKGFMSEDDLRLVHDKMLSEITSAGGRVDSIYHCSRLSSEHSFMRKPSVGMALQAAREYPSVKLKQSVMVGDMSSDMLFGRRAGMTTVLVGAEDGVARQFPHLVDYAYKSLAEFAEDWNSYASAID